MGARSSPTSAKYPKAYKYHVREETKPHPRAAAYSCRESGRESGRQQQHHHHEASEEKLPVRSLGACLADWSAALAVLLVLLLQSAAERFDDYLLLALLTSLLSLGAQIAIVGSLATAMALGFEGDQPQRHAVHVAKLRHSQTDLV